MDDEPMQQGYLPDTVQDWIQQVADHSFDGNWGHAAAAILEAAHQRYLQPEDRWAELDALMRLRGQR